MGPLISVIVPVYNQEKYLAEAIESVLRQSFQNFELLIIDDGSTDGSAAIISSYAEKDKRIVSVLQANAGKAAAINSGVSVAKAGLLAFMDSDDVMLEDRLKKQYIFHIKHSEIHATSAHCTYINQEGHALGTQRYQQLKTVEDCKRAYAKGDFVQCAFTALMVQKKTFIKAGGLGSEFWPCDDFEFFNRLVMKGYMLIIIQEVLMKYRLHPSSITASKPMFVYDMIGYIMHRIKSKRMKDPEITFKEFMLVRANEPLSVKFNRRRYNYSQLFFRNAGIAMMSKDYVNFLWQIIAAALLSPKHITGKVKNLVANRLKVAEAGV